MPKKIVSYKLNEDGTVPDFIEDGGYLAINPNHTPDMILFGVAKDDADISMAENQFASELDVLSFIRNFLQDSTITTNTGDVIEFILEDQVKNLFSKLAV